MAEEKPQKKIKLKTTLPQFKAKRKQFSPQGMDTLYYVFADEYDNNLKKTQNELDAIIASPALVHLRSDNTLAFDSNYQIKNMPSYHSILLKDNHFRGYAYYASLYQNGLISSIVDILTNDMCRTGFDLISSEDEEHQETDAEIIKYIEKRLKYLKIQNIMRKAIKNVFVFGGCFIFPEINHINRDETFQKPFILDKVTLNPDHKITNLNVIEPYYTAPLEFNADNALAADFYQPVSFSILGKIVHHSRLIKMTHLLPSTLYQPLYGFFGIPLIQNLIEYVERFERINDNVAEIIHSMRTTYVKTDMSKLRNGSSKDRAQAAHGLRNRMKTFSNTRNNQGVVLIDNETEDIAEINTSIAGLSDLLTTFMDQISVIPHIPNTQIWGTAPKGLNATGEFDMLNYHNTIASLQQNIMYPALEKIINLLYFEYMGEENPGTIDIQFKPLKSKNELENSQIKTSLLNDIKNMVESGILNINEARQYLAKSDILDFELDSNYTPDMTDNEDIDLDNLDDDHFNDSDININDNI